MISGIIARIRSLWHGVRRRSAFEAEMSDEFRLHVELRAQDLMEAGLSPAEALRQARLEFGSVEIHKDKARAARGLHRVDVLRFSWLDLKLGLRMLWKYPATTLVMFFALALGIPAGLAPTHVANAIMGPLPDDEGHRIRGVRYWNTATLDVHRTTSYELGRWREELSTFAALGGSTSSTYQVDSEDGRAAPVLGAQITASTFEILRIRPLLGRLFNPDDEVVGAPNVVIIGEDLWRARFGGDPDIVGKTIRIGSFPYVVIGVMPEGFRFPVAQQLWLPLREEAAAEPTEGFNLLIFGRLADGVTADEAQVELAAAGSRLSADFPDSHSRLQAEVVPFGLLFIQTPSGGLAAMPEFYVVQFLALVLLIVACGNVAMLVFARTTARFRELAVRTALGASRARIITQMFAESLVLAILATGFGLLLCDWALGRLATLVEARGTLPYWLDLGVTPEAMVWALGLAVFSAVVAGVGPALKVTGRKVQQNIQRARAGSSGIRFGGMTSAFVVGDVAVAVAVASIAVVLSARARDAFDPESRVGAAVGIPADEYLAVELRLPIGESLANASEFDRAQLVRQQATTQQALVERLEAEPRVRGVAVASALPRMDHQVQLIEVDAADRSREVQSRYVRVARVDVGFFEALERPVLTGRDFDTADLGEDRSTVIVNTAFVERVLGGRNPIGSRLRFSVAGDQQAHWLEIIGVMGHLGMNLVEPDNDSGIYLPAAPGEIQPMQLGIHLTGSPETFTARLREIVDGAAPAAAMGTPVVLDRVFQGEWYLLLLIGGGLVLLVGILVTLAASAIYTMMSFAVSERTTEIGLRIALGAKGANIVLAIGRRSLIQIGIGVLIGMPFAGRVFYELHEGSSPALPALLGALGLGMGIVLLLGGVACAAPISRALRITPTEVLKGDG